ncbi:recombinase family protein [Lawsonibacter asaccharolyticus]
MARKKRVHASPMRPEIQGALWDAGLYGRLSVLDNGKVDGEPIESQIAIIEQYVAGHPELKIVERYIDNGYTGTNFDRPNWERMMADVRSGRINCIIVKDLSRLGRNYIETGRFLERICPKLGIRFISVNDNYDTAEIKSQDEFAASLKNIVNDHYAKDISLKSGSALKAKRQRGEYIGSYAPHGYLKDPSNKNHLIINPETAPVIQQIYQWRAEGLGYGAITRMLNERDIPSPGRYRFEHGIVTNNNKKGSSLLWNRHALTDILRNIVYIGHLAQGKCTASLARGIPVHRTPESEWDIAYHTHDPIITEELFNQVQEINRSRADAYNANYGACSHLPKGDNPYRERLVCADCGTQMKLYRNLSKNHKKAYFTYICPTYEEHQELRCTKKTIRSNDLDAMVLKTLKIQMELFCDAQQVLERLSKKQQKFPAHIEENELQQLEQQIKRKQGYATSLYADYRTGLLTREEYTFARGKYQEEVAALQGRISQLQERLTLTSQVSDCAKSWITLIEQYKSAEIVSRELVTAFIGEIRLSADGSIKVSFLFQDELSRIRAHCKALESEVA